MASCKKDCLHYGVCCAVKAVGENQKSAEHCISFKNNADYVKVVRCSECKYRITHTCAITGIKTLFCDYAYGNKPVVEPTHYCGYGEMKST